MKRKEIILSYDYELFFGYKSGTVEQTLIHPTYLILDGLDKTGLKANFFVDYLMFKFLRENTDTRSQNDLKLLEEQICDIVRRGHRIELHIHSHWVDAKYNGDGTWNFDDFSHYSLNTFSSQEICNMFREGIDLLQTIARRVDPKYKIVAFRAGGWAIQPFSLLRNAFLDNHIIIDSSTARGVYSNNDYSSFDFRSIPSKFVYHFDTDVSKEERQGAFVEIPLSTYKRNIVHKVIDRLYRMLKKSHVLADGTHKRKNNSVNGISRKSDLAMFTLSRHSWMVIVFTTLFRREDHIVFIDHPKDFTVSALFVMRLLSKFCDSKLYIEIIS